MTCFEADAGKRGVASDSPPARLITRFQRKTQGRRCARSSSSLGQWPAGSGPRLRWAVLRAHSETRRPLWPLSSSQMMAQWLASTNLLSTPIVPLIDYIPAQSVNCLGVEISLGWKPLTSLARPWDLYTLYMTVYHLQSFCFKLPLVIVPLGGNIIQCQNLTQCSPRSASASCWPAHGRELGRAPAM